MMDDKGRNKSTNVDGTQTIDGGGGGRNVTDEIIVGNPGEAMQEGATLVVDALQGHRLW
jgi:hypothetical protein